MKKNVLINIKGIQKIDGVQDVTELLRRAAFISATTAITSPTLKARRPAIPAAAPL